MSTKSKTPVLLKTREDYKALALQHKSEALIKALSAPSWNTYIHGVKQPSKNDIMNGLKKDLTNLNKACVEDGHQAIFLFEEEREVVLPPAIP